MSQGVDAPRGLAGAGGWLDDRFRGARGLRILHRPLNPEERAPLQAKQVPALMPAPRSHDGNGVPAPQTRGLTGRARAIANRAFAETIAFQPNGQGNGHGTDARPASGGHAAAETDPAGQSRTTADAASPAQLTPGDGLPGALPLRK